MTDNNTRALLERACAKAVDIMLTGDDVATVRQATGHHVVIIRTVESDEREARTIQRREEHAERVRETGAAELARASDALASAAADVDALRAEVTRQTGIAVDHCARADREAIRAAEMEAQAQREQDRADAAEQMVVDLRGLLQSAHQAVVHEAGKRCDAAIAARDEAVARLHGMTSWAGEVERAMIAAERARDEVGIQLAAAQARIKLLEEGATLLRHIDEFKGEQKWGAHGANHYHVPCDVIDIGVGCFLSAIDAVPGDALAPRITAALEASGIDTANVKGVE